MAGFRTKTKFPTGFDCGDRCPLATWPLARKGRQTMSGILWIIIVGFVAGILARLLSPGPNNPSGFILTTVLGIVGAFLATFIGQAIGHYGPNQGLALSRRPSVRWSSCLSGTGWWHGA